MVTYWWLEKWKRDYHNENPYFYGASGTIIRPWPHPFMKTIPGLHPTGLPLAVQIHSRRICRGRRRKLRRSTYFQYVIERTLVVFRRTFEPPTQHLQTKTPPWIGGVFVCMARPARFERATAWFVARYSIQLSYGRVFLTEAGLSRCCWYVSIKHTTSDSMRERDSLGTSLYLALMGDLRYGHAIWLSCQIVEPSFRVRNPALRRVILKRG